MSMIDQNQKDEQEIADDFWNKIESEASKLEVTVDYYLAEFFLS